MTIKVLHSICQQIWKTQKWLQDWKRSVLIPIPKKGSTKECSNHQTTSLISQANKVMFKILQARLRHYINWELPYVQAGFRKGKGTRDQIANIHWITKKAKDFQKNIYLCFINYAKVKGFSLWLWIITNCGKLFKEMGIPDHLTCLLRNLYAGQKATVRTLYGTTDWLRTEKGVWQGCLFNLYTEHITHNTSLDELQAGIKIAGKTSTTSDMWMISL